jgi:thiol-disulfide isomerase/thioredoxin
VLVVLALSAAACGGGASGSDNASSAGDEAAASGAGGSAQLDGLAFTRFDGTETNFAAYRGKPLVVNFFASWCAPCVREMPEFEQVHQELGDQVTFLGLNVRDRIEQGEKLAQQTGVTYPLARDPRGDILTALKGTVMPTTAFITAAGHVALVQSRTYEADELRATIQKELLS